MARSYGQIVATIWRDPDFRKLPIHAQWAYIMLATQGDISSCGLLPLTVGRWVNYADDLTAAQLADALAILVERRFIVIDEFTQELLVRTFVKHDGGARNSKRRPAITAAANGVVSSKIGCILATELNRLGVPHSIVIDTPSDRACDSPSDGVSDTPSMPHGIPQGSGYGSGVRTGTLNPEPESGSLNPESRPTASSELAPTSNDQGETDTVNDEVVDATPVDDLPRPEVDELCNLLADRIEQNGAKRPTVTRAWRQSCRRMIDIDKRAPDQVRAAIEWSQGHDFWSANVLSMPKLREKFDQMRLQAQRDQRVERQRTAPKRTTDDKVRDGLALAERFAAQEAAATHQLESR